MRLLVQEDYNLSTALDSTSPRRQPALAYFVFWALGGFGDMMATLGAAGLEEKEFDLASVLEALARCLLVNQDPLTQSFVLSALTKLSVKMLPNPIPTSVMNVVRQQCQQHNNTTTILSSSLATIEVQQRAAELLMIAELAVS
ncbi:hypothetical protein K457DRAFT_172792 [Linnemannia elongata AG-77]|uniref:Uncharacterized protein n=1 Tax=Linnemannia elongata AG-77 TaxID=1314771 RepID=A0A197KK33_9FUNG|nr:hypothetical protein K457DRAFT_172792 [Linnemannia elongata AG-77]